MVSLPGPLIDQVSVVIPVHNRSRMLGDAIRSASEQTLPPCEIIVIDDGSTENGIGKLCELFPICRLIRQENRGVSHARNRGILEAKGKWIAFLDSDDTWHLSKLEIQNGFLQKNDNIQFVHTDEKWVRNGKEVNPPAYLDKSNEDIFSRSLTRCLIGASSAIISKTIFKSVGLFDEKLKVCEDYDLWLRILTKYPPGHIPQKLITKFGGHSDQLSTRYWGMDRFRVQSLENLLSLAHITPVQKVAILRTLVQKLDLLFITFSKHERQDEANVFLAKKVKFLDQLSGITETSKLA